MNVKAIAAALVQKAEDELMDLVEDRMEAEIAKGAAMTSARMDQIETDLLREVLKAMAEKVDADEVAHRNAPREDGF